MILAAESFNLESEKESVNYFEMMKRLNLIKAQGNFRYGDPDYINFFIFIIKIVITIAFDTLTNKRIENKKIDIAIKEKLISNYENEIKEIKSKIELIEEIKAQVEMNKTQGERRQMASKDNEAKERENDQKLIETVIIIYYFYGLI